MKFVAFKLAAVAAVVAAPLVVASATPAQAAGCGAVFNNVDVDGGLASWNIACGGGKMTISGWVKDTKKDNKCAYVKAFANNGANWVPIAKACPAGTTTQFSQSTSGASDISAYLFTA